MLGVGPGLGLQPPLDGEGMGPDAPGDLGPRQPGLLLEPAQPFGEVFREAVRRSAVVYVLSRHRAVPWEVRMRQSGETDTGASNRSRTPPLAVL